MNDFFRRTANRISHWAGSPYAFILASVGIIIWAISGPMFGFSDTWQLVVNTTTTIITFLMVFLIQNTQNRDSRALHLKMDELIRATNGARNELIDLEDMSDEMLEQVHKDFCAMHESSKQVLEHLEEQKEIRNL